MENEKDKQFEELRNKKVGDMTQLELHKLVVGYVKKHFEIQKYMKDKKNFPNK